MHTTSVLRRVTRWTLERAYVLRSHCRKRTAELRSVSAMVLGLIARQPIVRFIDDGGTKLAGHRQLTALASEVERRTGERCVTISS